MKLINEAYSVLSNNILRAKYDASRPTHSQQSNNSYKYSNPFQQAKSDTVVAHILNPNGSVDKKTFSKNSFSFKIDTYTDENNHIFIYNDSHIPSQPNYIVLHKYLWEYKFSYLKKSTMPISCHFYSEKKGTFEGDIALKDLHFECIDHITKQKALYSITYRNNSTNYFSSIEVWLSECKNIKKKKILSIVKPTAILIILAVYLCLCFNLNSSPSQPSNNTSNVTPSTEPYLVSETPPKHGTILKTLSDNKTSYIEFDTSGMNSNYCYIKAVDSSDKSLVQAAFICTGKEYKMILPVGSYELYYACGDTWYGYDNLFGYEGGYSYCESVFPLTQDTYYEVKLYGVSNGNMTTDNINLEDFANIS